MPLRARPAAASRNIRRKTRHPHRIHVMATFQAPPWWPSPATTFLRFIMIGASPALAMTSSPISPGRGDSAGRVRRGLTFPIGGKGREGATFPRGASGPRVVVVGLLLHEGGAGEAVHLALEGGAAVVGAVDGLGEADE